MPWTDSHAHLQFDGVGLSAIGRAREAGVERMVCIGTDASTSAQAVELASGVAGPGIWATVGLHPHDARLGVESLAELWHLPRIVGVGECGLDYHYDHSPREDQRMAFARQVSIAHERDLALVIHTRAAWDDTFAILASEGMPSRTVIHCFTGGVPEAERCLALGAYLSFSGIITFNNAVDVRQAAAICPIDRVLVETDTPFLAPVPHRGRPNEPALVQLVGAAVAAALDVPVAVVERASWDNTERVFRLGSGAGDGPADGAGDTVVVAGDESGGAATGGAR